MYTKSDRRLIVDHDLVTVNVIMVNGELEVDFYSGLKFSHGYLHELDSNVVDMVKNCLENIIDRYATNKVSLNQLEVEIIKATTLIPDVDDKSYLLINVIDVQTFDQMWNMSEEEKVAVASLLKNRGNYKAKSGDWSNAFKNYHRATKYLRGACCVSESKHTLHSIAKSTFVACMNNVALSCLKLSSGYSLCIKYCNFVLSYEPNNTKAMFRKAKALTYNKEWEKALECTELCLQFETDAQAIKEVTDLRVVCQKYFREQKKEEKSLCKDILSKMEELALKRPDSQRRSIAYDIDPWDNAMADEMLSIQQELEAFGEQMPPRCVSNDFCPKIDEEDFM